MSQKEVVYKATRQVADQLNIVLNNASVDLKEHKDKVVAIVVEAFANGEISTKEKKTDEEIKKYAASLVGNCWLKDARLNPQGYKPKKREPKPFKGEGKLTLKPVK